MYRTYKDIKNHRKRRWYCFAYKLRHLLVHLEIDFVQVGSETDSVYSSTRAVRFDLSLHYDLTNFLSNNQWAERDLIWDLLAAAFTRDCHRSLDCRRVPVARELDQLIRRAYKSVCRADRDHTTRSGANNPRPSVPIHRHENKHRRLLIPEALIGACGRA